MTYGVFVRFGGGLKTFVLSMATGIWRVGEKRMKPDFFQWCPGTRPEAIGMLWNTGASPWTSDTPFFLWLCLSTGTAYPEKLQRLPPWRYSKVGRSWSWATESGWSCLNRRLGQNDLQSPHPTSPDLQFCDSRADTACSSWTLSLFFSKRLCYLKT